MCCLTGWWNFGRKYHAAAADPRRPHTCVCSEGWPCIATEPYMPGSMSRRTETVARHWIWLGCRVNLFTATTWKQILWNDESAVVHLTFSYKLIYSNNTIYWPWEGAHFSSHQKMHFTSKYCKMKPKLPCCLVPASEPSVRFEWLLCIRLAKPVPTAKTYRSLDGNQTSSEQMKLKQWEKVYLAHAEKCFDVVWLVCEDWDTGLESCIIVVQFQLRSSHVV